jgi:excisionase family DNA binding protein
VANASYSEGLLSVREVAEILRLHPQTVYLKVAQGEIPSTRIGRAVRFDRRQIDDWLDRRAIKETPLTELVISHDVSLEAFDKQFLRGGSTVGKKNSRYWNYGIGGVFSRTTAGGHDRWYLQYKDESGKWQQKVVSQALNRAQAVVALQAKVREVFEQVHHVRPRTKRIGFSEYSKMYLDDYAKVNKRSWRTDVGAMKILDKYFGRLTLDEIDGHRLELYKNWRLGNYPVTKTTVNRDLALLRRMLSLAWNGAIWTRRECLVPVLSGEGQPQGAHPDPGGGATAVGGLPAAPKVHDHRGPELGHAAWRDTGPALDTG